jgi:tetratricopeptide (TPR) repeat protein
MSTPLARISCVAVCAAVLLAAGTMSACRTSRSQGTDAPTNATGGLTNLAAGEEALVGGDRRRALDEFTRALQINPTLVDAHLGIADIYRLEGDYVRAESGYAKAAQLQPQNFEAQYYHGLMLHLLDRVTDAIGAYLKALAVKPEDFQSNLNLSAAYYQLGENTQALAFGERAVRLNPRSGPARVNLAAIYADTNRHADAVVEYQQATESMELSPRLLLGYAESLKALDRFGEMRSTLEQLVRTAPSAAAHERLGYAQFKLEQYDQAMASFQNALRLDGNYFPALNGIGVCELNRWFWSDKRDTEARDRGLSALRRSLAINRNQATIEELLSRYR